MHVAAVWIRAFLLAAFLPTKNITKSAKALTHEDDGVVYLRNAF